MDLASVYDATTMRRSVRKFNGPLEEKYLKDLLNMTRNCASASNLRPVKFLVLHRKKMDETAIPTATVIDSRRPGILAMQ